MVLECVHISAHVFRHDNRFSRTQESLGSDVREPHIAQSALLTSTPIVGRQHFSALLRLYRQQDVKKRWRNVSLSGSRRVLTQFLTSGVRSAGGESTSRVITETWWRRWQLENLFVACCRPGDRVYNRPLPASSHSLFALVEWLRLPSQYSSSASSLTAPLLKSSLVSVGNKE